MPILHAPILEQAGFVKGALEPVKNYVARLDGVSQYWQLSGEGLTIPSGGRMEFKFVAPSYYGSGAPTFFDNVDRRRFRILSGTYDIFGCSVSVDGIGVSNSDAPPTDGLAHIVEVAANNVNIKVLGASSTGSGKIPVPLFGLSIYDENDVIIHEIPLTNKAQGATQLATVGSVNATMVNYTPDVWEEL